MTQDNQQDIALERRTNSAAAVIFRTIKIGLIVNPFAGLGGEAALKGSDTYTVRQQALDYHKGMLKSPVRVARFLQSLQAKLPPINVQGRSIQTLIEWYCLPGLLGQEQLSNAGFKAKVYEYGAMSSYKDTQQAVRYFLNERVDLIVFAGGDGTARDVLDSVGDQNPEVLCVGVPAGVKMQSGVFAITPESAAQILSQWVSGELNSVAFQDVRDIDEAALRKNKVRSKYYGAMQTLSSPQYLQRLKQSGIENNELVLDDIADHLDGLLSEGYTLLVGPGSTMDYFMRRNNFKNTLVGFDAVDLNGVVGCDLNAEQCSRLLSLEDKLILVITPTGQQGFLWGRGNQQLSDTFLRAINKGNICIVSTKEKLNALQGRSLQVDTSSIELNEQLSGFYPIITAYQESVVYPVGNKD